MRNSSQIELAADLLEVAFAAAAAGAKVLQENQASHLEISVKGEIGNLVTQVDIAAEEAVRAILAARRPDDAITGEELDDIGSVESRIRWSVDPLDGTTNFTRGTPYFGTSVGAVDVSTGKWLVGVVEAPALGRRYWARTGHGAWLTDSRGTRRLTGSDSGRESRLFGTGFSYVEAVRSKQYADLLDLMVGFSDMRSYGSAALGLCEAADGSLDAFVESDLFEFDWAAGALIAEEAGLTVVRPATMRGGITTYSPHS
jgi:myo-inositol-1(or 4)-monophosphatase